MPEEPFDEGLVADAILEMGTGYDIALGALSKANDEKKTRTGERMRYTQMLNQRLKGCRQGICKEPGNGKSRGAMRRQSGRSRREAEDTDSFFPWAEAAARL